MNTKDQKKTSKFLSLVLRHQPEIIGIELDEPGWVNVDVLLDALDRHRRPLTLEQLQSVVANNDKQRFAFSSDGKQIRANQGHSVDVALNYEQAEPPEILLHGAPEQFVKSIRESGLKKMKRHDVHLHADFSVAQSVGQRRGKPVILRIRSGDMHRKGHKFYVTPNNVWLVDAVPAEFIESE